MREDYLHDPEVILPPKRAAEVILERLGRSVGSAAGRARHPLPRGSVSFGDEPGKGSAAPGSRPVAERGGRVRAQPRGIRDAGSRGADEVRALRDACAILGADETEYVRGTEKSDLALQLEGAKKACNDAGIRPDQIDGIIANATSGIIAEEYIKNFGIRDLRYSTTVHMGGASVVASIQSAVLAIGAGLCEYVLIPAGRAGYSGRRFSDAKGEGQFRADPTIREAAIFEMPYGSSSPAYWYAHMAKLHMLRYGTTSEQLGAVAVAIRKHASLNENAIMRTPITIEEHQASRMIVDPFHLLDCCIESDGAASIVVSSAGRARERAQERGHPVALISGVGEGHPESPSSIATRPDLLSLGLRPAAERAFAMAGMGPGDVDVAELYDCFTYICLRQLEEIGFCKDGEGGGFVEDGGIELGGRLPVNTHGGLLSQAHTSGMNHVVEAVRQLRRQCGPRQIPDCDVALVSNFGDFGDGSVVLLRGESR
jgi:acetyl-CoA acetyltransferase